jgi:excisionase family DNA binding protein
LIATISGRSAYSPIVGINAAYRPFADTTKTIQECFSMGEVLTAADVASLLQVHPKTVYRLARRGLIPGRKLGGGWRFMKDEILNRVAIPEEEKQRPENPGALRR